MEKPIPITVDMIAPPNRRFANYLIDATICYFITLGIGQGGQYLYDAYGFEGLLVGRPAINNLKFQLLHTVVTIVYYGLFESLAQRTPGKYVTNTKVVLRDGTTPQEGAILLRTLCRQIPLEILSFLGPYGVGWHDTFSKTLVVDINRLGRAKWQKDSTFDKDKTEL